MLNNQLSANQTGARSAGNYSILTVFLNPTNIDCSWMRNKAAWDFCYIFLLLFTFQVVCCRDAQKCISRDPVATGNGNRVATGGLHLQQRLYEVVMDRCFTDKHSYIFIYAPQIHFNPISPVSIHFPLSASSKYGICLRYQSVLFPFKILDGNRRRRTESKVE